MAEITYKEAIRDALDEELARDENVFLLGEDIGLFGNVFGVLKGLHEKYGDKRVMDTPISESVIIGSALGSAITGLRPVAEIMFVDFVCVCMDQIVNQIAKLRYMLGGQVEVPLVIRTQGGCLKSFAAQHSQSLEAFFMHVPGIKVIMPATPADAKGLLKSAIRDSNPVMFIEHKSLYNTKGHVPDGDYTIPIGKANIVREGTNVTLVSYSRQVLNCLDAAESLSKEGIEAEVIDLRSLTPLDTETILNSVSKTNRVVIVEEDCKTAGVGAEIAAMISNEGFEFLKAPVKRVAALDTPLPCADSLENVIIPSVMEITRHVKKICEIPLVSYE